MNKPIGQRVYYGLCWGLLLFGIAYVLIRPYIPSCTGGRNIYQCIPGITLLDVLFMDLLLAPLFLFFMSLIRTILSYRRGVVWYKAQDLYILLTLVGFWIFLVSFWRDLWPFREALAHFLLP